MPQREFANQKALVAYAEQNDLAYEYEYTPAFAKRQRLLSPEQYEIVEVRTSRGVSRVMLFSKAIRPSYRPSGRPMHRYASRWLSSVSDCGRSGRSGRPSSVQRETSFMRAMLARPCGEADRVLPGLPPPRWIERQKED